MDVMDGELFCIRLEAYHILEVVSMPESPTIQRFGEKLRTLRLQRGMTTRKLADQLQTSSGYISNVENGKREPGAKFILKVAQFFNVSADVLLDDTREL
jgi:ribosome-binding protein aMBF1 (putative translation factor)